ncbi:MAG: hypothetical protein DRP08_00285 [Candidatus Aenigmatarchaeota archaeon]|nr:MAG: hypothetical protein DRP08_00285 [Candidatus Aenigmarchaeota archaeon]
MSIIQDIKSLKIQGAKEIAIASLRHLKKFSRIHGFGHEFDKECKKLLSARSTAVVLYNVINELRRDKRKETIDKLLAELDKATELIAATGQQLIKRGYHVHTHCHSSEALAVIKEAAKKKKFSVIADITMPRQQGIKTAKELAKIKNISVTLIEDNAATLAFTDPVIPKDDIIIVGCDAMRKEGVINKIGTYFLALAASESNIPFYVVGSKFKIDKRKKVKIEIRPPSEVYKKIRGVKIINPAFDITPWRYITGVVMEDGIKKPKDILAILR